MIKSLSVHIKSTDKKSSTICSSYKTHKDLYNKNMSLVSNFIGGISSSGLNGLGVNPNYDLNDTTFSDLLEKQMEVKPKEENNNIFASLGMPAGMQIENIDFSEKVQDQMEATGQDVNPVEKKNMLDLNGDGDVTTSEAVTFFTSLLSNSAEGSENRSELFDFAKKQASNFYNKYSRNVVTDIQEFVDDIQGLIS